MFAHISQLFLVSNRPLYLRITITKTSLHLTPPLKLGHMAFVVVFLRILNLLLFHFIAFEGLYFTGYRYTAFILEVTGYKMSLMSQISLMPEMNKRDGQLFKEH